MARISFKKRDYTRSPVLTRDLTEKLCFETTDSSILRKQADFLIKGSKPRDVNAQAARLANQFIRQNRGILGNIGINLEQEFDGNSVYLVFRSSTKVGAIPLLSPTSGKPDFGLIIKPRFGWKGLGIMLSQMGWRIIPSPLNLPLLPRSDRKIPPWVLSSIILFRLQALLDRLERRFEFTESDLSAPHGTVNWRLYATSYLSRANFLKVPCRFPDLRDDRELKAAIHFTLRKQLDSLESQRSAGIIVVQLIALCQSLLERVKNVPPKQPAPSSITAWYKGPLRTDIFRNGLQAMEWTIEDRGLAGLSDLQGLPWVMSMEAFFEAWIEAVAEKLVKQIGGIIKTGRKRETLAPLHWSPPYLGTQKYLLPDLLIERENMTIIMDAKYKSHWEDLNQEQWHNLEEELRERHRADLLQVLAYSTLFSTKKIISCLIYPCSNHTWQSLKNRERIFHRASLYAANREVVLILAAVPMVASIPDSVAYLIKALKNN